MKHIRTSFSVSLAVMILLACVGFAALAETVLTLPKALQTIDEEAFYGDQSIDKAVLPDGIKEIRARAFANSALSEINLPDSITFIDDTAFDEPGKVTVAANEGSWAYDWALDKGYITKQTPTSGEDFTTEMMVDGTLSITGYTGKDADIVIPSVIDGKRVTSIGDWAFMDCSSLTSIDLPDGLTNMGHYVFSLCGNLTSIDLPDGLKAIGMYVFSECSGLTSVDLPDGLTSIGESTFRNCSSLTSIDLPERLTDIGDDAFWGCYSLTSIDLANGVTHIGADAFTACDKLTVRVYGGSYAEQYCVENGVEYITHAFTASGACGDQGDNVKWTLYSDGKLIFRGTGRMDDYNNEAGKKSPWSERYAEKISSVEIENGVTSIGDDAFYGCGNLTDVDLPDGLTSIGDKAFYGCGSLTSVKILNGVTNIGTNAFTACGKLTVSVYGGSYAEKYCVEHSVKYIVPIAASGDCGDQGDNVKWTLYSDGKMFIRGTGRMDDYDNDNGKYSPWYTLYAGMLSSVEIDSGVTSIGDDAFYYCFNLTSIDLPNGLTSIGNRAFCSCSRLTGIDLPDALTSIGKGAFVDCSRLMSIDLPDALTSIGDQAFSGSGLTSIDLPDGLTSISDAMFSYCWDLTSIDLPDGLTSIGGYAFAFCNKLTSIDLPDGLTSIGGQAFYVCGSLTSITIPNGVTNIGADAFMDCDNLTISVYGGSYAEQYCIENNLNYVVFGNSSIVVSGD